MKDNLKKLKDSLFVGLIIVLSIFVVGTIVFATKDNSEDFSSIVMAGAEEVKFVNPLEKSEVLKDYSAERLQFNSTLKQWEAHKGVDLKANVGDKVFAIAGGKITSVETTHLMGTTITIEHKNGFVSSYSSLNSQVQLKVGDSVKAGDVIGTIDNSAKGEVEEGVHLHFELKKEGKKVDPNLYFSFGQK